MNHALMFSKASDEWSTPERLYRELYREFEFRVDVAANADNALCAPDYNWFGPDNPDPRLRDALMFDWGTETDGPCWMNPPYSKCRQFIERAAWHASEYGIVTVALVPSRTDTRWWHEHIWDDKTHQPRQGVEIRFVRGRLKFGEGKNSAPFPSVVVVFRGR